MKMWNKLLAVLDQVIGFPNMASSTLKKLEQGYDNDTEEHVIRLEYCCELYGSDNLSGAEVLGRAWR